MKADKYEKHGCEFLNEAECEEELDEDNLNEDEYFDDKSFSGEYWGDE